MQLVIIMASCNMIEIITSIILKGQMHRWNVKFKELFGIDIRSLALFRIGLALVLLVDLFIRIQDLTIHYSDEGLLPRSVLINQVMDAWNISFHLVSGTWQVQLVFFMLEALFAVALLVGFHTRLATILSWIFLISLHSRNPLILQGGDVVLRMLLFWGMFLPLGACWSIDQRLWDKKNQLYQVFSGGTAALLLQVCFIYWFSALLKTDASWRQDGTAVWYALSNELFATSTGKYLLQFPFLLKISTFATLYLEAFGPFLAFSPIWTGPVRTVTAIVFILFHLMALNLTMELGIFPYVCAVAWMVFLPGWFWERILGSNHIPAIGWKASRLSNGLAIFFLIYVLLWNIQGLNVPLLSPQLNAIGPLVRIDQYWNMFAPYPLRDDGWFVIPAKLRNGNEVDLFTDGGPVSWQHPELCSTLFKNDRWKSFMMNLVFDENNAVNLSSFASYLCERWNKTHPYEQNLVTFEIIFMGKINYLEKPAQDNQKNVLWHHLCY